MEDAAKPSARAEAATEIETPKPSGRLKWADALKAHTGWKALTADADVSYGRGRVTVSGVEPTQRNRIARCAIAALDPHGYDAYRELDPHEPSIVRIMVKDG